MKPSQVEVVVNPFLNAHGRRPSGNGRWAFCTVNPNRADYLDHVLWEHGNYGDAKAAARLRAAAAGKSTLWVCS